MIHVTLAYIFNEHGDVLIAQRPEGKSFGLLWEFPGGKVESNETVKECIKRELREELNVEAEALFEYPSYSFQDGDKCLEFYPIQCRISSQKPICLEHEKIMYVSHRKFSGYDFAPPDYEAINILLCDYEKMLTRC
ncbi:(deoxy)nucleoside triphosphate pyrophosphohydrolase [Akkermansiaceae bacterium]|nr:(deoxy)nucleoside triphosphate pyrophosphohydrolase [Akkermansiaceae bacterium]